MPERKPRVLALDTETTGLDLYHGAEPYLVTFCDEARVNTWFEWEVDPETRRVTRVYEDLEEIQRIIDGADELVLQNAKFDYRALWVAFCGRLRWDWSKVHDTIYAGHLLASNHPHDLASMSVEYLGVDILPLEARLKIAVDEAKKTARREHPTWRLAKAGLPEMPSTHGGKSSTRSRGAEDSAPWKYDAWLPRAIDPGSTACADYANGDSSATAALWPAMRRLLEREGLWKIYLERRRLLPILCEMEERGITLSRQRLTEQEREFQAASGFYRDHCLRLSEGRLSKLPVNGTSNDLKRVIFDRFQLQSPKKTKRGGQPSLDKTVLDHWIAMLPGRSAARQFILSLRAYRKRQTALGYLESYRRFALPRGEDGALVIHSSLNATGTDTLRFSSSNPNQQQASKQEESNVRYVFGPAPGREWWCLDFLNLELRIPAYEAGEEEMIRLFEHTNDPPYYGSYHLLVFDVLHPEKFAEHGARCKDVYKATWYQWTKNGNFAVQYGAIESSGTADAAYHVPGAQHRIQHRFGKVKQLNERMIAIAEERGYVETIPDPTVDPRRGYPLYCTRMQWGRILPTVPLNYHVQGTAMWLTIKAMIRCAECLKTLPFNAWMTMQVHDELVFDFPRRIGPGGKRLNLSYVQRLAGLMEQGGKDIGIPTPVSISYHPQNWKDEG